MSLPEWQQLSLGFVLEPFSDGKKKEKSKRSKRPTDKEDTTWTQLSLLSPQVLDATLEQWYSTLEFPAIVKNLISLSRLSFCVLASPKESWLQKSDLDSTSSEKSFSPYWNEFCQATSEWLSLPIRTGYVDLGSILSHGSQAAPNVKFWFSTNQTLVQSERCVRISSPSSTSSVVASTDLESIGDKFNLIQTLQVRFYPPKELEKIWKTWLAGTRRVYNATIAYLNQNGVPSSKELPGKGNLKQKLKTFILNSDLIPDWVKTEVPSDPKQNAVYEALTAYRNTKLRLNRKTGKIEKIAKFRSVRDHHQTLQFDDGAFKRGTWTYTRCKGFRPLTKGQNQCPWEWKGGTELTYRKCAWYGSFTVEVQPKTNLRFGFIALDPGVRCFLTGFDGSKFLEFGNGDFALIAKLCSYLDNLQSKHDKCKGQKFKKYRYRLRQVMMRLRQRIKNLVDECHKQVAHYLASNYKAVALPTFETSQMVAKSSRKIKSKTARAMLTWSFYRFSQVLENQCRSHGTTLLRHTEEYTSKVCTKCGSVHHKLGGSKTFNCPKCGYSLPRDFNGALGNFLKALWDTTMVSEVSENYVIADLSDYVQQCPA